MSKILIASLWTPEPVLKCITKFGADKLYVLVDKDDKPEQKTALNLIKESIGKVILITVVKIDQYDIIDVASKTVKIIDTETDQKDKIYIDITAGRKPIAMGLLFASYTRTNRINTVAYVTEENKDVISLPKLSFKLTESQRKILEYLEKNNKFISYSKFAEHLKISRAMLYNNIKELSDTNLIYQDDEGIKLSDAGKIAIL